MPQVVFLSWELVFLLFFSGLKKGTECTHRGMVRSTLSVCFICSVHWEKCYILFCILFSSDDCFFPGLNYLENRCFKSLFRYYINNLGCFLHCSLFLASFCIYINCGGAIFSVTQFISSAKLLKLWWYTFFREVHLSQGAMKRAKLWHNFSFCNGKFIQAYFCYHLSLRTPYNKCLHLHISSPETFLFPMELTLDFLFFFFFFFIFT